MGDILHGVINRLYILINNGLPVGKANTVSTPCPRDRIRLRVSNDPTPSSGKGIDRFPYFCPIPVAVYSEFERYHFV